MAQPKYLTGDVAAINEFIDKFDVSLFSDGTISNPMNAGCNTHPKNRCFCSTAMVFYGLETMFSRVLSRRSSC